MIGSVTSSSVPASATSAWSKRGSGISLGRPRTSHSAWRRSRPRERKASAPASVSRQARPTPLRRHRSRMSVNLPFASSLSCPRKRAPSNPRSSSLRVSWLLDCPVKPGDDKGRGCGQKRCGFSSAGNPSRTETRRFTSSSRKPSIWRSPIRSAKVPCEAGSSVQSQSLALTSTARTTSTPCSRASRTICAGA